MQSTFEHNAQRAAVQAVENRLAHNDQVRKQASKRRTLSNLGGWLVGLAILAAIGYWFYGRLETQQDHARQDRVPHDNLSVRVSPSKDQRPQDKRKRDRKAVPKRDSRNGGLRNGNPNVKPIGNR